jgi:3-hydroxyisobutyrate dehydrogenase
LKLANQTIVAGIVTGLAEGLAIAARGGIADAIVLDALGRGTARGFLFDAYAAKMLAGDYAASFSIAHFIKDLKLAAAEADALAVDADGLRASIARFERLAAEHGDALGIQGLAALYRAAGQ